MAVATKRLSQKYTFGLRRSTILVSILNALLLFGAAWVIGWEAWGKLFEPAEVSGTKVMIVAGVGVVINTVTALLFMKGQKDDLNIRGAYLHMAADAGVSVGVVVSGLLINITGYNWIDPVTSFLILIVIVYGTWQLFIDSINLALNAIPKDIDYQKVKDYLLNRDEVNNLHDLHIWAMSTTENALSAHLVVAECSQDDLLKKLKHDLHKEFEIIHTTIQLERKELNDSLDME